MKKLWKVNALLANNWQLKIKTYNMAPRPLRVITCGRQFHDCCNAHSPHIIFFSHSVCQVLNDLKTNVFIVEVGFKNCWTLVSVLCDDVQIDGPMNSQEYKSFEIYMVTIMKSVIEYHLRNRQTFKGTGYKCRRVECKSAKLWGEMVKELSDGVTETQIPPKNFERNSHWRKLSMIMVWERYCN